MAKFFKLISILLFLFIMASFVYFAIDYLASGLDIYKTTVWGFKPIYVVTESMTPTIEAKSFVIAQKSNDFKVGDIIAFVKEDVIIVHRIQSITEEGIITKGDFNAEADNWVVNKSDIVGKIIKIFN